MRMCVGGGGFRFASVRPLLKHKVPDDGGILGLPLTIPIARARCRKGCRSAEPAAPMSWEPLCTR